ncbi:MAG: Pr6Pr family membrane protein [Rhodanobacteraceae bacterium]
MTASRLWHAVLAALVLATVVAQLVLLVQGGVDVNSADAARPALAERFVRFFSFFTVESNLFVLATSIALVVDPERDGALFRIVRLDALLGIAITWIVFALVLSKIVHVEGLAAWINFGFHDASPVLALVGWLLFGPRPRIDARTIALAFVWPIAWIVYTLIRGALVAWYPYPFLDAAALGYPKVLANVAIVIVLALVLASAMRWIDSKRTTRVSAFSRRVR